MLWLKLGWRNLRRNRRRTVIELAAISGSVFIAMYFNNMAVGSYNQMIDSGVRMGSGHIGVYREDYLELRRVDQTVPIGELVPHLREVPGVEAVYSRLYAPGLVRSSRDSRPAVFLGLDFEAERSNNPLLQPKRLAGGSIPEPDNPRGALIGITLAKDLSLRVGNKFVLMTQGPGGEIVSDLYRVAGILDTGLREFDSGTVLVSRESLAAVIGRQGQAHEIALMLRNAGDIPSALPRVRDIVRGIPGVHAYDWREAMPSLAGAIRVDHAGLQVTVVFLYLIVGIGAINTLLMSVMERTREFGIVRAMGLGRRGILGMVFSEAFVLGLAGVGIGAALTILLGIYTATEGIDFTAFLKVGGIGGTLIEPIIYTGWDWLSMIVLGFAMILLALAASLYPAWHVLRIRPADAIRSY